MMKKICMVIFCLLACSVLSGNSIYADVIDDDTQENNFIEEHKEDLRAYSDEFQDDQQEREILVWTYPLSGEVTKTITESFSNLPFEYLYLDTEGNQYLWGYVNEEDVCGWICFNEPDNESLAQLNNDVISVTKGSSHKEENKQQDAVILVIVLVLLLITSTGIIIAKFWKKEK